MNRAQCPRRASQRTATPSAAILPLRVRARAGPSSKRLNCATTLWYGRKATRQRATPMRNARLTVALGLAALALGACHKGQQAQTNDQAMAIDEGMPNQMGTNADIETLPADESSTTPSNQL